MYLIYFMDLALLAYLVFFLAPLLSYILWTFIARVQHRIYGPVNFSANLNRRET